MGMICEICGRVPNFRRGEKLYAQLQELPTMTLITDAQQVPMTPPADVIKVCIICLRDPDWIHSIFQDQLRVEMYGI